MGQRERIRVLIADDSFFIRTYLAELLRSDPEIEVVGSAANGEEAVMLAKKLHPDVITMDYHMPVLNGIEATAAIMLGDRPLPAIIMLSAFEGEEGKRIWKALAETGAHIIVKPSGEISLDIEKAARTIIDKVKEVGRTEVLMRKLVTEISEAESPAVRKTRSVRPAGLRVLAIGASTGGPPLIEHLLTLIASSEEIAIVVAQHMSAYFTRLFADHLNRVTGFTVREMENDDRLAPGTALVVPGGYRLLFRPEKRSGQEPTIELTADHDARDENTIDRVFEEVGRAYGIRSCGVLLSGMGKDGSAGVTALAKLGGTVIIQNPREAAVASMPEHALASLPSATVLSIETIPEAIRAFSHKTP